MRIPLAIAVGAAAGALVTVALFVALGRDGAGPPEPAAAPVVTTRSVDPHAVVVESPPSKAVPITPTYRANVPQRQDADMQATAPQSIYRCRSKSGTSYSNEPCPGGTVVDESSAVSGYDSRPSDRLTRLVAQGRTVDGPQQPVYRASSSATDAASDTTDCRRMRAQVRDIDAVARQPNDQRTLDELRSTRQDIRTSMARLHC